MLDKSKVFKACIFTIVVTILNTTLVIKLYDLGFFNFGIDIVLPINLIFNNFIICLLCSIIIDIALYFILIKMAYDHYKIYGASYIKTKLNGFKKEIIFCYCLLIVVFLLGKLFPAFAFGFIILGLLILGPITAFVLSLDKML